MKPASPATATNLDTTKLVGLRHLKSQLSRATSVLELAIEKGTGLAAEKGTGR
jgi:hypothetical protein